MFNCIEAEGVTLSGEKSQFSKPFITFLDHMIDQDRTWEDSEKVHVIDDSPQNSPRATSLFGNLFELDHGATYFLVANWFSHSWGDPVEVYYIVQCD